MDKKTNEVSHLFEKEYEASAKGAAAKVHFLQENPLGYVMVSLLGGAYLGFGILLTYAIESYLRPQPSAHIVMGISFGVALSLSSWPARKCSPVTPSSSTTACGARR